jgi:plastocyanin
MLTRRMLLAAGGLALTAAAAARAADGVVTIHMVSDPQGSHVGFDPIGVLIAPGQTVRWVCDSNVHTTTAYHPANSNHSLRIPDAAKPWNSGFLLPGKRFELRLTVPGVYDYFCAPHEMAGMVGRIIVGHPAGPGSEPLDYFLHLPDPQHWLPVPPAAQAAFPAIEAIMQLGWVALR